MKNLLIILFSFFIFANSAFCEVKTIEKIEIIQNLAIQNDVKAQRALARLYNYGVENYETGEIILKKDKEKAFEWYQKAALNGDAKSQWFVGIMYFRGEGIEQDYKKAAEWYEKSAMQGDASAQLDLAEMYRNGKVIDQNLPKAFEWFEKAALNGIDSAQLNVGIMYQEGRGVKQNLEKAFEWTEKAALSERLPQAQINVAVMYRNGIGVPANNVQAYAWLLFGNRNVKDEDTKLKTTAQNLMAQLEQELTEAQIAEAETAAEDLRLLSNIFISIRNSESFYVNMGYTSYVFRIQIESPEELTDLTFMTNHDDKDMEIPFVDSKYYTAFFETDDFIIEPLEIKKVTAIINGKKYDLTRRVSISTFTPIEMTVNGGT